MAAIDMVKESIRTYMENEEEKQELSEEVIDAKLRTYMDMPGCTALMDCIDFFLENDIVIGNDYEIINQSVCCAFDTSLTIVGKTIVIATTIVKLMLAGLEGQEQGETLYYSELLTLLNGHSIPTATKESRAKEIIDSAVSKLKTVFQPTQRPSFC